jgi:hypothetical protein
MSANKLKRGNADRVTLKGETYKIGVDLDKVSQAAEKLTQVAARTARLPQKLSIRHSPSPIPHPPYLQAIRVLDLDPVM